MKNPYKTKIRAGFKVTLPKKQNHWPRIETWKLIPEGYQNEKTEEILTEEEFELHQLNQQDGDLVDYIIKKEK